MKTWLKQYQFIGAVAGVLLGGIVFLGGKHLYQDHQTHHLMVGWINQQIAAQEAAKPKQ